MALTRPEDDLSGRLRLRCGTTCSMTSRSSSDGWQGDLRH